MGSTILTGRPRSSPAPALDRTAVGAVPTAVPLTDSNGR